MRRRWRGGVVIALLLGLRLSGGAAAAEPPARGQWRAAPIWKKWFPDEKPAPKPPPREPDREVARKLEPAPAAPSPLDVAAAERDREEKAYLRRLNVCLKLNEIAEANKDEVLAREVQRLEERIWSVYSERTGRLTAGAAGLEMDEELVHKHLGRSSPRLPPPTVRAADRDTRAALPEEDRP